MYLHRVSQLGTLDEPRAGWEVGAEPQEGAGWTYPEDGRTPGVHAWVGDDRQASVI